MGLGALSGSRETTRSLSLPGSSNGGVRESGSVFDGLTANRRSCVECGYTEAVMHFAFDNWQLAVPRMVSSHQNTLIFCLGLLMVLVGKLSVGRLSCGLYED